MNNYLNNNLELFKFVFKRFGEKLLAILGILFVPFALVFIIAYKYNFDFSIIFGYIFGAYGIVVTVILFDYILILQSKEAKYFNSINEIQNIKMDLEFIKELMMSDKTLPIKAWKDKLAYLSTYNGMLKNNDKLLLSSKKDDFDNMIQKLNKIDSDFSKKDEVNFSDANRTLSTECNDILQKLILHIEVTQGGK